MQKKMFFKRLLTTPQKYLKLHIDQLKEKDSKYLTLKLTY